MRRIYRRSEISITLISGLSLLHTYTLPQNSSGYLAQLAVYSTNTNLNTTLKINGSTLPHVPTWTGDVGAEHSMIDVGNSIVLSGGDKLDVLCSTGSATSIVVFCQILLELEE